MTDDFKVTEMEWRHHLPTRRQHADLVTRHRIDSICSHSSAGGIGGADKSLIVVARSPHLFGMLSILRTLAFQLQFRAMSMMLRPSFRQNRYVMSMAHHRFPCKPSKPKQSKTRRKMSQSRSPSQNDLRKEGRQMERSKCPILKIM